MKIALLAMSGVRAHDKKLMEFGLTLPGFVERSKVVASLPSLGLLYLAAVTPGVNEGRNEVRYYEAEADGKEPAEIYDADLVAISTFSAQVFEAYAIADRLRSRGVKVAMGGLHVTAQPDEAMEHADYVVIGEGERAWPEVVRAAESGRKGILVNAKMWAPVDVKELPVPRYDLLGDRPYNRFTVQTSRGCPWRCEFCASTVMLSEKYRKRPVDHVVRDIQAIQKVRPNAFIEFADDNTFVDKSWGKELCRAIKPLRVKWFTETDITVGEDAQLVTLMRQAGCRQVLVGLESPGRSALEGIELHANMKARWHHRYADAVRNIQKHGVTVNGCFVLGLDGHGPEIFEQVFDFAMSVPLYEVQITTLTAFPGTPLYTRLLRERRVVEPGRWDMCTLFDVNYHPKCMSRERLREGLYWLGERLYSAEATEKRRTGFYHQWKDARVGQMA